MPTRVPLYVCTRIVAHPLSRRAACASEVSQKNKISPRISAPSEVSVDPYMLMMMLSHKLVPVVTLRRHRRRSAKPRGPWGSSTPMYVHAIP